MRVVRLFRFSRIVMLSLPVFDVLAMNGSIIHGSIGQTCLTTSIGL